MIGTLLLWTLMLNPALRRIACLLATGAICAVALVAQPSNIEVLGATSTQAVVRYTAPDENACTLEVSPESDFTPLHADVDPTKFGGSDSDGGGPRERTWVIGKRGRFFQADSGEIESRALRAAYPYFGRLTCTGGSTAFEFTTRTVPWGNVYEDVIPPMSPGEPVAMPTPPDGDRWWGAHPATGVYFGYPLSRPGDMLWNESVTTAQNWDADDNASWSGEESGTDNELTDDEAFVSTTTASDWLTFRKNGAGNRPTIYAFTVRLEGCQSTGSTVAERTVDARFSFDNGVTWSEIRSVECPPTRGNADSPGGADRDYWGLPIRSTEFTTSGTPMWLTCRGKVNDAGAGAATSTTINFDDNNDCLALKDGSSIRIADDDEGAGHYLRTISGAPSCGGAPSATISGAAIDIDNGGNGVPCAMEHGFWGNDRLVAQVRMASTGAGTLSFDALQFLLEEDESFDQVNAGSARENGYENTNG